MYFTYILFSLKSDKFYTGQTEDLNRRVDEHNRGKTPFMERGKPWIVVFSKEFTERAQAIALEKKIKKRGAARFIADINL
jgi:putative endonuclease